MTTTNPAPGNVALQLYTVRSLTQGDLLGVLDRVAAIGYAGVEFAGLSGIPATQVRSRLDGLGLAVAGVHVPLARWEGELEVVLDELVALGSPYGVVPIVPAERRQTAGAVQALAAIFTSLGRACAQRGIRFAYHHHAMEFEPLSGGDGRTMLDLLIEETDPAAVAFEVDLYWAVVGGADPAALLARLPGRAPLVHLKDAGTELSEKGIPADLPAGEGTLPWETLIPAVRASGARWFIAEQDNPNPADPLADAATAWRNITRMTGSGG
jgi:sugar phosphate isomerase/epimerase